MKLLSMIKNWKISRSDSFPYITCFAYFGNRIKMYTASKSLSQFQNNTLVSVFYSTFRLSSLIIID